MAWPADFNNYVKAALKQIAGGVDRGDTTEYHAIVNLTASTTPQAVKAAVASNYIYITDISISVDAAMWVQIEDDTGTPIVHCPKKYLPANSVWSKQYATPKKVALGKAVNIDCSVGAGNVSVEIDGYTSTT